MDTVQAYISMGSNLADRYKTLREALDRIDELANASVRRISQFVETEPVGGPDGQQKYLNAAVEIETSLSPRDLLKALQEIETALGRNRSSEVRWGPRTCDLDLLLMGLTVVDSNDLTLPHPRMHERLFVLGPLATIAPEAVHPVLQKTIAELLEELEAKQPESVEPDDCCRLGATLISIIGPPASGKTTLAEHLAPELGARIIYEDYAGNPFLADAYAGDVDSALPAQLYYLISRVKQLARSSWPADGVVISDYGFCQDRIYASRQLSEQDMQLYDPLARRMEALVRPPDLIIRLDVRPAVLLKRIAERGREFEKGMTEDFLASMCDAYDAFEAGADCEIIHVEGDGTDLRVAGDRRELLRLIRDRIDI